MGEKSATSLLFTMHDVKLVRSTASVLLDWSPASWREADALNDLVARMEQMVANEEGAEQAFEKYGIRSDGIRGENSTEVTQS